MAGYCTDVRSNSAHEYSHILLLVSVIDGFKDGGFELHNAGVAVGNEEFGASELLGNSRSIIGVLLACSWDRGGTGERNTLHFA